VTLPMNITRGEVSARTRVQGDVRDLVSRVRVQTPERISDEVARVLFQEWKKDASLSIGDLFRAIESKRREAAKDESEAIASDIYDSPSARSSAQGASRAIHRGVVV